MAGYYLICTALAVTVFGIPVPKVDRHDPTDPKWKQLALRIIREQEPGNQDWANDNSVVNSVVSEDLGTRVRFTIEIHTRLPGNHDDICMVKYDKIPQSSVPFKPVATCYCPADK